MQVDPIKPTLKVPATERLKLKCQQLLSNFGFKSNLRRYTKVWMADPVAGMVIALGVIGGWSVITWEHVTKLMGRDLLLSTFWLNLITVYKVWGAFMGRSEGV